MAIQPSDAVLSMLGRILTKLDDVESRLVTLESRLDAVESRLDTLESTVRSFDERIASLEERFNQFSRIFENWCGRTEIRFLTIESTIKSSQSDYDIMKQQLNAVVVESKQKFDEILDLINSRHSLTSN